MKNWKTSLFGAVAAGGTAFGGKWGQIAQLVGLLGMGFFGKDNNVTGGTVAATPEAEKRV